MRSTERIIMVLMSAHKMSFDGTQNYIVHVFTSID